MYVNGSICVSDPEHIAKLKSLRGCSSKCHLLPKQDSSKEKKSYCFTQNSAEKAGIQTGEEIQDGKDESSCL